MPGMSTTGPRYSQKSSHPGRWMGFPWRALFYSPTQASKGNRPISKAFVDASKPLRDPSHNWGPLGFWGRMGSHKKTMQSNTVQLLEPKEALALGPKVFDCCRPVRMLRGSPWRAPLRRPRKGPWGRQTQEHNHTLA